VGSGRSRSKIFFARDVGIRQEKLPEKIAEWAGIVKDKVHLVVEKPVLAPLRGAIRKQSEASGLEFLSERRIAGAVLPFEYRCYNREIGRSIVNRLRRLPAGLSMDPGYEPVEEVRPEAAGVEMYSPEHEYTVHGKGKIRGPVDKVIRFRALLDEEYELVELASIRLESP
jgi:hypothetical protein